MATIKNCMETMVRAEIERRRWSERPGLRECWCDQCEADILALALTSLPPRYCREATYGLESRRISSGMVTAAVEKAVTKVSKRPKHRPGIPEYFPHRLRVVNFAFQEAWTLVPKVLGKIAAPCTCSYCSSDTLAWTLNRFQPLYGVERDGTTRLPPETLEFYRHDLMTVMERGAQAVALHPHH